MDKIVINKENISDYNFVKTAFEQNNLIIDNENYQKILNSINQSESCFLNIQNKGFKCSIEQNIDNYILNLELYIISGQGKKDITKELFGRPFNPDPFNVRGKGNPFKR